MATTRSPSSSAAVREMLGCDLHRAIDTDPAVYDEIKYVGVSAKRDETHFTVWVADKLVADLELQPNPYNLGQIWMMHVAVRKGNEGRGYARQLIEAAAQRAHEMGKCLSVSEFSDEGRNKLGRLFGRLKRKYPRGVLTHG